VACYSASSIYAETAGLHCAGDHRLAVVGGYRTMKPRDISLRSKRFDVAEKARKVASLETMIRDLEHMAADLYRQIQAEEERTGVRDSGHFAYSTFAKAAALRRANQMNSINDLRTKLDIARREHEEAALELGKLEPVESRDHERHLRKVDRNDAMIG
jgi:flagellar protein FliJ